MFFCQSRLKSALVGIALVLTPLMSLTAFAQPTSELEEAYRKEFAFLEEQQRNLKARLDEQTRQQRREAGQLEAQINGLNQQMLDLDNARAQLNEQLSDTQRELENLDANKDAFELTYEQAGASLGEYGMAVEFTDGMTQDEQVTAVFNNGLQALTRSSEVVKAPASWFSADGKQVEGEMISIGRIAAFGLAGPAESGALAPIGDGKYRVLADQAQFDSSIANAIAAGNGPESLPLFLFEGSRQSVDIKPPETVLEYINSGGIVAWIIIGLGALAMLLVVLRAIFLSRAGSSGSRIVKALSPYLEKGQTREALDACKKYNGSTSRVVQATLRNADRNREYVEDVISESILHESPRLNRFGALIMIIASIAPLLGLLGTVTGMISTFDIITEFGTGDPKLLSGGISTALVTTQLGLIIAIPALVLGNLLSGWSNRIKDDMEKLALTVVNSVHNRPLAAAA